MSLYRCVGSITAGLEICKGGMFIRTAADGAEGKTIADGG